MASSELPRIYFNSAKPFSCPVLHSYISRWGKRSRHNIAYPSRRLQPIRKQSKKVPENSKDISTSAGAISNALRTSNAADNSLLAPVHVPEDPNGVLNEKHPSANILAKSSIVVQRQLELMNVLVGYEQANKYIIMDPQGNHIGYMAEQELGMGNMMARQLFSTHRSFTTHVFDRFEKEVLRVCSPWDI